MKRRRYPRYLNRTPKRVPWRKLLPMGLVLSILGYIPMRLAIAQYQSPEPQAILTLGGAKSREYLTARLSRSQPDLEVWVSSGSLPTDAEAIFSRMGASTDNVNLDYNATDTLSNFTTILPQLQDKKIQHLYLVTSDYHMPRAKAIAAIVLGSHGITVTPVTVPSQGKIETMGHVLRDVTRSFFWLATGKTGSHLKQANCYGTGELEAVAELFKPEEQKCHRITRQ